jgi:regulatory protein
MYYAVRGFICLGWFGVQISTRLWHKYGVPYNDRQKHAKPPLNQTKLRDLALHYVGRYASSTAKLAAYLQRKIQERGWDGPASDIDALISNFVQLGYINDASFAAARARALTQRGYGLRRISEDLRAKGIDEADSTAARDQAEAESWQAAQRFAKRKRIGPFATTQAAPELRQKQLQAFLRAGHSYNIARIFVAAAPGQELTPPD